MTRDSEARLMQFCVAQQDCFDVSAWQMFSHPKRDEMVAAALFLAGVDWYGHRVELIAVAEQMKPGSTGHLSRLVSCTGFDCSRFSNMLRRQLDHALAAS